MKRWRDAAVLLNGQAPANFVGHLDESNNEIGSHQELTVPPSVHELTVTRYGKELWTEMVTVGIDQCVIVNISNGKQTKKDWPRGSHVLASPIPSFKAGTTSATAAIAPASATISANPSNIDCGQNTLLSWACQDTVEADMSGMSPLPTTGERNVSPRQTTTYELTANGPGGVAKPSSTIEVNTAVQSSSSASPMEIRYRRIGDKVIEQESTTLSWSSTNSDAASLDSIGAVTTSGSKSVALSPTQTGNGGLDEQIKYTLTATNVCGSSAVTTVAVHLTGSVEPVPGVLLQSVFFPTDYPTKQNPSLGLLRSQQEALTTLATGFKRYLEYDSEAKLSLGTHADERGAEKHNQDLSQLRAERFKDSLVSKGISADKIDVST
jgi:outer membrane protein OmpA-like peptidoglycan-associated protein